MIRPTTKEPANRAGTTELLNEYRAALVNAYSLGEEIKDLYSIVPPKVLVAKVARGANQSGGYDFVEGTSVTLSLNIS
jgi:hypothetical protein